VGITSFVGATLVALVVAKATPTNDYFTNQTFNRVFPHYQALFKGKMSGQYKLRSSPLNLLFIIYYLSLPSLKSGLKSPTTP